MSDLEHAFDSADWCTRSAKTIDLGAGAGAGAGAGSRENMLFMVSRPLCELVWSTDTGLGLRYADSNSAEKKGSLLWDTESFNIIVSPSPHDGVGGSINGKDRTEGNLKPMQLELIPETKNPTIVNYGRSLGRNDEHYSRSYGDMELFYKTEEAVLNHMGDGVNLSKETDVSHSAINNKKYVDIGHETDVDEIPDGVLITGDIGASSDHCRELVTSAKFKIPIKSESSLRARFRCASLVLDHEEDKARDRTGFYGESIDFEGRNEAGMIAASGPQEEGKIGTGQAFHMDKSDLIRELLNIHVPPLNMGKDKECIIYDAKDSERLSKVRADCHNRVGSNNIKMQLLTKKRAWSFYTKMYVGGKKFKIQSNENYFPGSIFMQVNSFMSWISTMTSGFIRINQAPTSLALIPQPSHSRKKIHSLLILNEKNKGTSYLGLLPIFQSLCHLSSSVQYRTPGVLDHIIEADNLNGIQVPGGQFNSVSYQINYDRADASLDNAEILDNGSLHIVSQGKDIKFHKQVSILDGRPRHCTFPYEELSSIAHSTYSTNHEYSKNSAKEYCNLSNIKSPRASAPDDSESPSEGKKIGRNFFVPNSSSDLMTDNMMFLDSLWVTRLSPKASVPILNSVQCNQGVNRANEMFTNKDTMVDPPSQNDAASIRGKNRSGNCHSSFEGQRVAVKGELQVYSIFPTCSCVSNERDANQNPKSSLHDVLSSQWFGRLEFTDAPNVACASTTCFFCGKSSHSLRECSELIESLTIMKK